LEKSQFKIGLKTVRTALCGTYEDRKSACKILVRKPEGKRTLGRPKKKKKVCSINRLERHKLKEKRGAVVGTDMELQVIHTQCNNILVYLRNYQLTKKASAPRIYLVI
jgi:hypothetical protein